LDGSLRARIVSVTDVVTLKDNELIAFRQFANGIPKEQLKQEDLRSRIRAVDERMAKLEKPGKSGSQRYE
jgi:hypothetical protein